MSVCNICDWVRRRFFPEEEAACKALWSASSDWEYYETGYFEMLDDEPEANRALLDRAADLKSGDSEAASSIYLDLAKSGSPTAMILAGWCLENGAGVERDDWQAVDWYRAGIATGSWTAAIFYALLFEKLGHPEHCEAGLQDGIDAGLATASYRLARCRYERARSRTTAREIRELLDRAITLGHPGAKLYLAELQIRGKYGIGSIFRGVRLMSACLEEYGAEPEGKSQTKPIPADL